VQLLVVVEVFQAEEQLPHNNGNIILANVAGLHEVGTASTRAELHDDPQFGALGVGAIVLCDVGRLQLGQDGNLLDNILHLVFGIFYVNDLDGNGLAAFLVDTKQDECQPVFLSLSRAGYDTI
jgi:hypothetical protein